MKKTRILIVDDDANIRALAVDVLSEEYEVMEAIDGQDGWEKAQAWKPDLVMTDIMMPRMHGFELCGLLKGVNGIKGVKVIIASSKPYATDKEHAKKAGADSYIMKPFDIDNLMSTIENLLLEGVGSASNQSIVLNKESNSKSAFRFSGSQGKEQGVKVCFWGTRGSCPCPGLNTVRYGGNTSCIEIRVGKLLIIFECGSGLRDLGNKLMQEFGDKPIEGHIFVGHTHWDHIQGFPFFVPLYIPKNSFNIYSVHGSHGSLQDIFSGSMASDYFPIPLDGMAGKLNFVEMAGPVDIGGVKVSYHHLNHPGVCIGFKIEAQGKVITYIGDHEDFRKLSGDTEISRKQDSEILSFAHGSDILIREAQYTEKEYETKKGWGHSTFDDVVKFGAEAGAKKLVLFHHDPSHTDDMMDAYSRYCSKLAAQLAPEMTCSFAHEGDFVDLGEID
ncbi:MAG: response regulator [Elusimicrobiota bacterium]|nr:response regulator [Elusimicrobiota bacterium]